MAILVLASQYGSTAIAARALGPIAYLVFFAINMLLAGVVLQVPDFMPWVEARWRAVKQRLGIKPKPAADEADKSDKSRFGGKVWAWFRRRGAFWFVLAWTMSPAGPAGGAAAARFLKMNTRRTWRHVFVANVVATAFFISLYLGHWSWGWGWVLRLWAWFVG